MYFKSRAKWSWWVILATMVSCTNSVSRQPNILFIMVDDMGWNDVSFHGSDQILTPNIDTLAYQGVILQQYYSEAICTPARTALLTGKYPMRLGMHGTPLFNSEDRGIPLTERLLPSYMKELGYSTHLVGKWHVGMSREEFLPVSRGYDTHYGMRGGYVDYYTYNKVEMLPDGSILFGLDLFDKDIPQSNEQRYIVDALTDRAVKIIQTYNSSTPLFLHVAHNAPHAGNTGGALQPPLYTPVRNSHIANSDRRLYADIVTHLDKSIGRLIGALADKGILEDTLILFMSDNGAPTVGALNNWGINLPFRGKKYTPWEGGVRVPAFMWHSSLRPRVWNGLMHITDWLPTLIAAAGGELRKDIDGVNQWNSIVENTDSKRREVLLAVEDNGNNVYAAYRAGDYKLIVGNVTGVSNGYYGHEFLPVKVVTQNYFATLKSCEAARALELLGYYLDRQEVQAMRQSTIIKKQDTMWDSTPCEPTLNRGCLYNVRRDPTESHDVWDQANGIAVLMTNRLRTLWAKQMKRGPFAFSPEGNPAFYNYTWMPWINSPADRKTTESFELNFESVTLSTRNIDDVSATVAAVVNCDGTMGIRNFLCVLRSIF